MAGETSLSQHKRTIVIAYDGSPDSEYALDFYQKEVHKAGDSIILVHTLSSTTCCTPRDGTTATVYVFDRNVLESMLKDEQKKVQQNLEQYAKKLKAHGLGGRVKSVLATQPGEGVIKAAEEEGADLIISGCRGLGTVRRTIMGSVSDYIVHHSPIPVMVCRHTTKQ